MEMKWRYILQAFCGKFNFLKNDVLKSLTGYMEVQKQIGITCNMQR